MRIKRALATALTAAALTLPTAPVADARAAAPGTEAAAAPAAVPAPDGFLYAWEHPHAGGFHCKWSGPNGNWGRLPARRGLRTSWNNGWSS
ncbi:hypothetical protein [Streptomyces narbonensis]